MSSFSETELRILAFLLSLLAVYLHSPSKELQRWLNDRQDIGIKPNGDDDADGSGKNFVDELQNSVSNSRTSSRAPTGFNNLLHRGRK